MAECLRGFLPPPPIRAPRRWASGLWPPLGKVTEAIRPEFEKLRKLAPNSPEFETLFEELRAYREKPEAHNPPANTRPDPFELTTIQIIARMRAMREEAKVPKLPISRTEKMEMEAIYSIADAFTVQFLENKEGRPTVVNLHAHAQGSIVKGAEILMATGLLIHAIEGTTPDTGDTEGILRLVKRATQENIGIFEGKKGRFFGHINPDGTFILQAYPK